MKTKNSNFKRLEFFYVERLKKKIKPIKIKDIKKMDLSFSLETIVIWLKKRYNKPQSLYRR